MKLNKNRRLRILYDYLGPGVLPIIPIVQGKRNHFVVFRQKDRFVTKKARIYPRSSPKSSTNLFIPHSFFKNLKEAKQKLLRYVPTTRCILSVRLVPPSYPDISVGVYFWK